MSMLRTFLALDIDDHAKSLVKDAQKHLREVSCDIKWVLPEQAHLTLKFLGDTSSDHISIISSKLKEVFSNLSAFDTQFTSLGAFPNDSHPKIIWIGLDDTNGQLGSIAHLIDNALKPLGFPKEDRDFKAHITIARLKSTRNLYLLSKALKSFSCPSLKQKITHVTFYQSTLSANGSQYAVIEKLTLGKIT